MKLAGDVPIANVLVDISSAKEIKSNAELMVAVAGTDMSSEAVRDALPAPAFQAMQDFHDEMDAMEQWDASAGRE